MPALVGGEGEQRGERTVVPTKSTVTAVTVTALVGGICLLFLGTKEV